MARPTKRFVGHLEECRGELYVGEAVEAVGLKVTNIELRYSGCVVGKMSTEIEAADKAGAPHSSTPFGGP